MTVQRATPELDALVKLFYRDGAELGIFQEAAATELPAAARKLLAHDQHMTVTVEAFHRSAVTVEVLQTHVTATHYSRKIVLRRTSDQRVVLFGLVRLNLSLLGSEVRREIESEGTPLGHVLIQHNVMRTVRLLSLWRVQPAAELARLMQLESSPESYGRTALIYCDGVPAVELLEIIPPPEVQPSP